MIVDEIVDVVVMWDCFVFVVGFVHVFWFVFVAFVWCALVGVGVVECDDVFVDVVFVWMV